MRKKLKRRVATTLIELIVVLVMMGFFIMMVFNMFNVTYDAYNFNRELAAKTYAQANVDNFFEMLEKELMYAGSMGKVIKKLDGFDPNKSINIEESTITVQYALAEQIILTKKDKDKYPNIESTYSTETTFFPLYPANIPGSLTNRWVLTYDDIQTTQVASLLFTEISTSTVTIKNASGTFIMFTTSSTPATYVSLLLREKAYDSLSSTQILLQPTDTEKWAGEMIYKSTIAKKAPSTSNESTKLTVKKTIPTIGSEYEIALMDNIIDFKATETSDLYVATISYLVPGIYQGFLKNNTKEASLTVSRKFLKTQ